MRSAIIENGTVVNVITGEIPGSVECDPEVSKGWTYSGGTFSAPVVPEPDPEDVLAEWRKGAFCSRMQALIALSRAGELEAVEAAVAAAPIEVQLAWANAQTFYRNSPTIKKLAAAVGWGDKKVDGLFRLAATVDA